MNLMCIDMDSFLGQKQVNIFSDWFSFYETLVYLPKQVC